MTSYDQGFPWTEFTIEAWIQSPKSNANFVPVVTLGLDLNFASYFAFGYLGSKLAFGNADADGNVKYIFGQKSLTPGAYLHYRTTQQECSCNYSC